MKREEEKAGNLVEFSKTGPGAVVYGSILRSIKNGTSMQRRAGVPKSGISTDMWP